MLVTTYMLSNATKHNVLNERGITIRNQVNTPYPYELSPAAHRRMAMYHLSS